MTENSTRFEMKRGVKVFSDHSIVESKKAQDNFIAMIEDAEDLGCEQALNKHDHNVEYLTDETRAKYIDFIKIEDSDVVLEIGASMGQHTRLIAKKCNKLEALEVVPEQAMFAKLWCEQSGSNNVCFSAGGASGYLPYESNTFNLVIMNYVLEWSASRADVNPEIFHLRLLSEIQRILRPGGRMFVSTKNRYSLRIVLGGMDEHLGIRFGNALPRVMGRLFSSSQHPDEPKGYLHSRKKFEKLISKAGFSDLQAILFFPDARNPAFVEYFDVEGMKKLSSIRVGNLTKKDKLFTKLPAFLKKNVAASHAYLARKQ
ncbi:MAG: methyltransferase domain-containing protein [Alphaproteobacteria bacterium]|nr:methyltransferase domain-containing protein [Alphaproteobacteria bacterium]